MSTHYWIDRGYLLLFGYLVFAHEFAIVFLHITHSLSPTCASLEGLSYSHPPQSKSGSNNLELAFDIRISFISMLADYWDMTFAAEVDWTQLRVQGVLFAFCAVLLSEAWVSRKRTDPIPA